MGRLRTKLLWVTRQSPGSTLSGSNTAVDLFFRGHPFIGWDLRQIAPGMVMFSKKKKEIDSHIAAAKCAPRTLSCHP